MFRHNDSAVTYIDGDVTRGDDGLVEIPIVSEESATFDAAPPSFTPKALHWPSKL